MAQLPHSVTGAGSDQPVDLALTVLESVGLELKGAGVLSNVANALLGVTGRVARSDLDPYLKLDTVRSGEVLDDLLGQLREVSGAPVWADDGQAEEPRVLRRRRLRPRGDPIRSPGRCAGCPVSSLVSVPVPVLDGPPAVVVSASRWARARSGRTSGVWSVT